MSAMRAAAAFAVAVASVSGWVVPSHAQLDHLVVAIRSLDEGMAQFEALTGVTPVVGGKHPGRGTENALVSLGGGSYLEILAPQAGATLSPDDEPLRALAHLTIVDWAVSVPDVDVAVAALKAAGFATSPPKPGARLTPAGERLDWMTFGLTGSSIDMAPFFIRWSPNSRHPSTTTPGGCALERLAARDPEAERLAGVLGALDVKTVSVTAGASRIEASLTCGSTHATLTSR
jgi:hypothetical protein